MKKSNAGASRPGYIHGYSEPEQERLSAQSRFLEPMVFSGVDFSKCRRVLEIGCGVGAQTGILLERFPGIFVHGVDVSPAQIAAAESALRAPIAQGRVRLDVANAERLPFAAGSFDGAFICWVLEHAPRPDAILREVRRVLSPGGVVHGIEVQNSSLYLHPDSPAVMAYWDVFNRAQRAAGGDPFVGAKIGNLMRKAGFTGIEAAAWTRHYDQRDRAAFARMIDYWQELCLSAAPQLLAAGLADKKLIAEMKKEHRRLKGDPAAVFFYTPIKFRAVRP